MAFDSLSVANELLWILENLPGMGAAQIGAPASISPKVGSYVTMGSQAPNRIATGVTERDLRMFCMLVYRLDGAEATAETTLMTLADRFVEELHLDLTLNGVVRDVLVNSLAADEPDYQLRAGKEYREYPIIVSVKQRGTYQVSPINYLVFEDGDLAVFEDDDNFVLEL